MSDEVTQTRPGDRYSRQLALPGFGAQGQARLAASTVVIIGCGALGSMQAELLARAGVGKLVLVDRDVLELHNLQRQLLYDENDVREGLPKAAAAARRLAAINSEIRLEARVMDVLSRNIAELVEGADLILDGTDNFEIRYLINDAAIHFGVPWVCGGVLGFEGTVMTVRPGQGACLRCVFPEPPDAGMLPTCETAGVLNAAVAWVASLQVAQALQWLLGVPDPGTKLFTLDIMRGTVRALEIKAREKCPCCGRRDFEFLDGRRGATLTVLCGRNAVSVTPEKAARADFEHLRNQLESLGEVRINGLLLEFSAGPCRLIVFPDHRVLVMGTTDPAVARSLISKYLGN
jgi:adenylyltransferase/sulfurtransferase